MRNISDVFFEFVATCCYFHKMIYTALTLFFHMCKRYILNQVFACIKSLLFFNSLRTVNPSENFREGNCVEKLFVLVFFMLNISVSS